MFSDFGCKVTHFCGHNASPGRFILWGRFARNLSNLFKSNEIILLFYFVTICWISLTLVRVWRCNLPRKGHSFFQSLREKSFKSVQI